MKNVSQRRPAKEALTNPIRFPEIVPIVLREAAKFRREGTLKPADFERKLARLAKEELTPLGLELLVRDLADGTMRFLIKESQTGRICEMIDCEPNGPTATDVS
jgi:hypothetical protein